MEGGKGEGKEGRKGGKKSDRVSARRIFLSLFWTKEVDEELQKIARAYPVRALSCVLLPYPPAPAGSVRI